MFKLCLSVLACLILSAGDGFAYGCKFDQSAAQELETAYWTPVSGNPTSPYVYVIGAPWCPHTANVFKDVQSRKLPFELRFVILDANNEKQRDQNADLALSRSPDALRRVFVEGRADISKMTAVQRSFVDEMREATEYAMQSRMDAYIKTQNRSVSGWPFLIAVSGDKVGVGMSGNPKWADYERYLGTTAPRSSAPHPLRKYLTTGLGPIKPQSGSAFATRNDARLRVLPHPKAVSTHCLDTGHGFKVTGMIEAEGQQWYVFQPFQGAKTRVYGAVGEYKLQ